MGARPTRVSCPRPHSQRAKYQTEYDSAAKSLSDCFPVAHVFLADGRRGAGPGVSGWHGSVCPAEKEGMSTEGRRGLILGILACGLGGGWIHVCERCGEENPRHGG